MLATKSSDGLEPELWFKHGIRSVICLKAELARRLLLRELSHVYILLNHGLDIRKNGADLKKDVVLKSGIPISEAALAMINVSGNMTGCELDHMVEIQDLESSLLRMSEAQAIEFAWESMKFQILTRAEHRVKTRQQRLKRGVRQ